HLPGDDGTASESLPPAGRNIGQPSVPDSLADHPEALMHDESTAGQAAGMGSGVSVRARQTLLVTLLAVVSADVTIYRAEGMAGPAAFIPIATALILTSVRKRGLQITTSVWLLLLAATSLRLLWAGNGFLLFWGLWLLSALALHQQNRIPFVGATSFYFASAVPAGLMMLYDIVLSQWQRLIPQHRWSHRSQGAVLLPVFATALFAMFFLFANPDQLQTFSTWARSLGSRIAQWMDGFSIGESVFLLATALIFAGLIRQRIFPNHCGREQSFAIDVAYVPKQHADMFAACRNTLVMLSGLFTVYLCFEFSTLWFRTFPPGFHYSGYAHEGAAWLTAALGTSTLLLSMMFRGPVLLDPRLPKLQRQGLIWSVLNFVLAVAVFNRLFIYIRFNGMTEMRVVGLLGISAVAGGMVLVIVKFMTLKTAGWLIRRQLWLLSLACFLLAVVPWELAIQNYNVTRILSGHPEPAVQISEHEISDYATPELIPLLNSEDPVIRSGVTALLADRLTALEERERQNRTKGWSATQLGTDRALHRLRHVRDQLEQFSSYGDRRTARANFRTYSMQWW
ncbi:MAG: DUF4173 domain-containing protein, partial [Planctomycetaceae bacterium]|nr:DUF4173 domain-containing protein [Planctomycetaceae bacterium]